MDRDPLVPGRRRGAALALTALVRREVHVLQGQEIVRDDFGFQVVEHRTEEELEGAPRAASSSSSVSTCAITETPSRASSPSTCPPAEPLRLEVAFGGAWIDLLDRAVSGRRDIALR